MTRDEYLEHSKKQALEYLDDGDVISAVGAMLSDMKKHPECGVNPMIEAYGVFVAAQLDIGEARRFIEGFR